MQTAIDVAGRTVHTAVHEQFGFPNKWDHQGTRTQAAA
jgi:hypothetical protein